MEYAKVSNDLVKGTTGKSRVSRASEIVRVGACHSSSHNLRREKSGRTIFLKLKSERKKRRAGRAVLQKHDHRDLNGMTFRKQG